MSYLHNESLAMDGAMAPAAATPVEEKIRIDIEADATTGYAAIQNAVPVVRSLLRPGVRPEGTPMPADISVFAPALALAGLLPTAR